MWTYEQATGKLFDNGVLVETGYAGGNEGRNPEGVNNSELQQEKGIGPLPKGLYQFGTPVEHSHLGPFAIPLLPDSTNEMFNRSGFYMHGDTSAMNHSASEGCIIMPRAIREQCDSSQDRQLEVV